MYKAAIRAIIRRNVRQLNEGNYQPMLRMAADDAELTFPGDSSLATQFREPQQGRTRQSTHRGTAELEAFAQRVVDSGLQFDVEDILVNGAPWNTRICVRATDLTLDDDGVEIYSNRVVLFIETRWGRIRRWEDYLDTQRVAMWDRVFGLEPSAAAAAAN